MSPSGWTQRGRETDDTSHDAHANESTKAGCAVLADRIAVVRRIIDERQKIIKKLGSAERHDRRTTRSAALQG